MSRSHHFAQNDHMTYHIPSSPCHLHPAPPASHPPPQTPCCEGPLYLVLMGRHDCLTFLRISRLYHRDVTVELDKKRGFLGQNDTMTQQHLAPGTKCHFQKSRQGQKRHFPKMTFLESTQGQKPHFRKMTFPKLRQGQNVISKIQGQNVISQN